ncbi:MAG TPA: integrase family protein [Xanthobacteraceae bacterium]|nr:integrase family protein [Xanthobacteraceae bacterium]
MPKRVPALSVKKLAAVRPGKRPIELVDGYVPGLRVRVLPSGKRAWSLNIHDSKGVRRRFEVGSGFGLAEARRKAEDLRRDIRGGADPTTDRRAARQRAQAAKSGVGTLGALLQAYFTKGPGGQLRRGSKSKRHLETVFAKLLNKPVLDIERAELQLIADNWSSTASASLAIRILRPCLKWAERRNLVRAGVVDLEQPGRARKRDRVVTTEELKAIWPYLRGSHGKVIKWLLWTGCRLNEAAGMKMDEISSGIWTIPAGRAKNGRARAVPLPSQAVDLLRAIRSEGEGTSELDALAFPSKANGILSNWDRETKRLQRLSNTSGWNRHDLRRTVATMLGDLGFAPHVVSVVLGHAHIAEGATAVYARSRYQREHRDALQALSNAIDGVVTDGGNIVWLTAVQS